MDSSLFCKIAHREASSWIVHETDRSCAFLDVNPMNPYHTLVISKVHFSSIFDVPNDGLQEMMGALKYVVQLYKEKLGPTDV